MRISLNISTVDEIEKFLKTDRVTVWMKDIPLATGYVGYTGTRIYTRGNKKKRRDLLGASNVGNVGEQFAVCTRIFLCLRRGRYCPEAVCAAQYVLRVLLQNAQHAQHVQNANNTRITRRTRRTRSTEF